MTFNRKKFPNRDPEKEADKIKKRFGAVTTRFARAQFLQKLTRDAKRAGIIAAVFLAALLALMAAAGITPW